MNPDLFNGLLRRSFPRVPLAVPFWDGETYRNIFRCLLAAQVVDGPDLTGLKNQLVNQLGVREPLLCGSASLALELALHALGVTAGDEVILPAFCCSAVVPPVLARGATPVLTDVGPELNLTLDTVQAVLTRNTKAVIVPHLFGNPAEIDKIIELVRGKSISVIDDAAQALGATIDGRPVGTFGDAGVISFGAEKVCFGIGGGVLMSQREDLLLKSGPLPASLSAAPLESLSTTFFLRRLRRYTRPFSARFRSKAPDEQPLPYRREKMSNLAASLAASLMRTLPENIALRRARVTAYRELLRDCSALELIPHRAGSACLTQLVRLLPRRRDDDGAARLITELGNAGIEVQGSYMPLHLLEGFHQCVWDRLPYAEKVWPDLVELPCEPSVALRDIENIASIVRRCLR